MLISDVLNCLYGKNNIFGLPYLKILSPRHSQQSFLSTEFLTDIQILSAEDNEYMISQDVIDAIKFLQDNNRKEHTIQFHLYKTDSSNLFNEYRNIL